MAKVDTATRPEGHDVPNRANLDRYKDRAGIQRAEGPERTAAERPPRIAGPTHDAGGSRELASEDAYYRDAAGIRRIVRKGDPIPVGYELIEDDGEPPVAEAPGEPDVLGQEPGADVSYDDQTVSELKAEVERRNADRDEEDQIAVEGTGSGGNVTKPDLVAELEYDDKVRGDKEPEE